MTKPLVHEFVFSIIILGLIIVLVNPFNFWMPMPMQLTVVAGVLVGTIGLGIGLIKHLKEDEREEQHRLQAYKLAYLATLAATVIAIIWQSFSHQIDIWVVVILMSLIFAKLCGLLAMWLWH